MIIIGGVDLFDFLSYIYKVDPIVKGENQSFNLLWEEQLFVMIKILKKRIDFLKNFSFAVETTVIAPGINAKMNDVQTVIGLLQLKYINGYTSR